MSYSFFIFSVENLVKSVDMYYNEDAERHSAERKRII